MTRKSDDSGAGVVRDKKLLQLFTEETEDDVVDLPELIKERKRNSPWDEEILVYGKEKFIIKEGQE